jgi:uncharacterized membrane protein
MMGFGGMGGFGAIGILVSFTTWGTLFVLGFWTLRRMLPGQPTRPMDSALEILQRRYARGEISTTEFEQAKHTIETT